MPICEAKSFLHEGRWVSHPQQRISKAVFSEAHLCSNPAEWTYACSPQQLSAHGVAWTPAASNCTVPELSRALLPRDNASETNKLRTLWLIGDSVTAQMGAEAFCRIAQELSRGQGRLFRTLGPAHGTWRWASQPWSWSTSYSDARMGRKVQCASAETRLGSAAIRLCLIPAGTLSWYLDPQSRRAQTTSGALLRLILSNQTRAHDLAVVNMGAWFLGADANGQTESCLRIGQLAWPRSNLSSCEDVLWEDALALRGLASHHPRCPQILYRETLATHFATSDGLYARTRRGERPPSVSAGPSVGPSCPATGTRPKPAIISRLASAFLKDPKAKPNVETISNAVGILDGWALTRDLHELHMGAHLGANRSANESYSLDCVHYCSWSGINAALLDAAALWASLGSTAIAGV